MYVWCVSMNIFFIHVEKEYNFLYSSYFTTYSTCYNYL